jgi:hypothetical protein
MIPANIKEDLAALTESELHSILTYISELKAIRKAINDSDNALTAAKMKADAQKAELDKHKQHLISKIKGE